MIPIFSNSIGEEELEAVRHVAKSRWIGPGKECETFEKELAAHFGVKHVLLTNSATSALYLAVRCMNLQPGDEVIIPTIHFVATASAVLEAGGEPVFADVNPRTLNLEPAEIARLITGQTVGVIVNHYGGHPASIENILSWCKHYDLWLVEDAANAPASTYRGQAVGTFGQAGVWSFDSMKILSMADGGCLYVPGDDTFLRAWELRNLGLNKFSGFHNSQWNQDKWWEFEVAEPSAKFDSNDLLACIGRVQLRRLHDFIRRRKEIWLLYQKGLHGIDRIEKPPEPLDGSASSYYLYWIQTDNRNELAKHLYDHGIYTTFRYYPLHKAFGTRDFLPGADRVAERTLCLPIHQNLSNTDVVRIVEVIRKWADA